MATSATFNSKYSQHYDLFNSDKPYEKEIKFVYEWAQKPKWIFDIGCGTGSYWKYYPKDVQVLGVDKSRSMAQRARHAVCADITKYKHKRRFECATALFDVLNYIPIHDWWGNIPVDKGGYFIFDIWDKKKVERDGFRQTTKSVDGFIRVINPTKVDEKSVDLDIYFYDDMDQEFLEKHKMYLWDQDDVVTFCGSAWELVDIKATETWQSWYKCRRR